MVTETSTQSSSVADWKDVFATLTKDNPDFQGLTPKQSDLLQQIWVVSGKSSAIVEDVAHSIKGRDVTLADIATDYYRIPADWKSSKLPPADVADYQARLFAAAPTAVLRGLVKFDVIPSPTWDLPADDHSLDDLLKAKLIHLFDEAITSNVDITRTSARDVMSKPGIYEPLFEDQSVKVVDYFETIQRLQAVVILPEQIGDFMRAQLRSAQQIARKDVTALQKSFPNIGLEDLQRIKDHALVIETRNEQVWINLLKTRSADLVLATPEPAQAGVKVVEKAKEGAASAGTRISLENIFKEISTASCEHCGSVLSPSAYFVDLLSMLSHIQVGSTPLLDKFLERRGDLETLELSCANTNDLIEYIDLVHETLQSYCIALSRIPSTQEVSTIKISMRDLATSNPSPPSGTGGDVYFDMEFHETCTSTLVYPISTFPFNFASYSIDRFLEAAGTSRLDVMKAFSSPHRIFENAKRQDISEDSRLYLARQVLSRAASAQRLGLFHEDFMLVTGQACFTQAAVELEKGPLSMAEYRKAIGWSYVWLAWGYKKGSDMLDINEDAKLGLTFVQDQLLPRSGLSFQELADILRTQYIGGRLLLVTAKYADKFNGKLDQLRLRFVPTTSDRSNALNVTICHELLAFIRLLRKLKWSIAELDASISCLYRNNPALGAHPTITPEILEGLSFIKQVRDLTGISVARLQPLWGDIDISGPKSLYATLFLQNRVSTSQKLFIKDSNGRYLSSGATLGEGTATLTNAFGLSDQDYVALVSLCGLKKSDDLSLSNVSRLYRYAMLKNVLNISVSHLNNIKHLSSLSGFFDDPKSTYLIVSQWQKLVSYGWTTLEISSVCGAVHEKTSDPLKSKQLSPQIVSCLLQQPTAADCLLAAARLQSPAANEGLLRLILNDILLFDIYYGRKFISAEALDQARTASLGKMSQSAIFIPPDSAKYTFFAQNMQDKTKIILAGSPIAFEKTAEGWQSKGILLQRGELCLVESDQLDLQVLQYRSLPSSKGLPLKDTLVGTIAVEKLSEILEATAQVLKVITTFELDEEEVRYLTLSSELGGGGVRLQRLDLTDLEKISQYVSLRKAVQSRTSDRRLILQFLRWSADSSSEGSVTDWLARLTSSSTTVVDLFIREKYGPNKTVEWLRQTFQKLTEVEQFVNIWSFCSRTNLSMTIVPLLFRLANPQQGIGKRQEFQYASDLRNEMRVKFSKAGKGEPSNYDVVVRKLVDQARSVLIQYLISHDYIKSLSLDDADSLFEYFLIDVNMGPGLKTSRIKQAISTVQLYVQRCILGLETKQGIKSNMIDQKLWDWMRSYQLWEANRKVFLYPENWIDPSLRDDKSQVFKELEGKIMQSNLDTETMGQLVKSYVFGVNELSDLEIQAYLWDTQKPKRFIFHLFARTRNSPYVYYYRHLRIVEQGTTSTQKLFYWSPWEKMSIEIPTFETDAKGDALAKAGSYLIPTMRSGRLYLFIPQLLLKTVPVLDKDTRQLSDVTSQHLSQNNSLKYWELRMGWSELRNGQWSEKKVSQANLRIGSLPLALAPKYIDDELKKLKSVEALDRSRLPKIEGFKFWVRSSSRSGVPAELSKGVLEVLNIDVECWFSSEPSRVADVRVCNLGRFEMREYDIKAIPALALPRDVAPWPLHEPEDGFPTITVSKNPDVKYTYNLQSTIPTRFSKVEWSGAMKDQTATQWRPLNDVYHAGKVDQPILAKVFTQSVSKDERQFSWTMSFDDSQAPRPTGLVVGMVTKEEGNQHYLLLPLLGLNVSDGNGDIVPLNNTIGPFLMERAALTSTLETLYSAINTQLKAEDIGMAFGLRNAPYYHEQAMPFSVYNWELGFHVVSLLMERLFATQQLELALEVAKFVFDPTIEGTDVKRCWKFPPFKKEELVTAPTSAQIVQQLISDQSTNLGAAVQEWRENPFAPHAVARNYPVAYMKRMVRKYIEILIALGDQHFRQGTLESMPLAIQRYIEASHLFGARPTTFQGLAKGKPLSYKGLVGKLNDFGNAPVELNLDFPFIREPQWRGFSNATPNPPTMNQGLLGILQTGYFCVPQNPDLVALRDLIDDRLYKIRNCQDINGKGVTLRLFEPALDPGALIQAQAAGISLSSFLAEATAPMPKLRFAFLMQKAFELCNELKSMGEQFIAIKEKRDAEALSALRSSQELATATMSLDMKKLQRDEAAKSLEAMLETRRSHETRLSFYLQLVGEENRIPAPDQDWQDIIQSIEKPTMDDLRMSNNEKIEFDLADEAAALNLSASTLDTIASGLLAIPRIEENVDPMGMGISLHFDASVIAQSMLGASAVTKLLAQMKGDESSRAARKAQLIRQLQERRLQANMAGREIVSLDKQIAAQRIRVNISESELKLQEKQIAQSKEMDLWCRSKYTNEKLYIFMENSLSKIFQDTYEMASGLARTAKRAFEFESGKTGSKFLRDTGYWDKSRDGLYSAQNMYLDLKRMENAYLNERYHDFEISKTVSLRQLDPLELLQLRTKGKATFTIPEILYDFDFPGQFMRRLKSVAVSIPCIVGPYTSISCTLKLTSNQCRVSPLRENTGTEEAPLSFDGLPITSIAVSHGQTDAGIFDLSFANERYAPFEGAGAISTWEIELPSPVRQFDYETISDVIMHIHYTAKAAIKNSQEAAGLKVLDFVKAQSASVQVALFDIKNDYASEWLVLGRQNALQGQQQPTQQPQEQQQPQAEGQQPQQQSEQLQQQAQQPQQQEAEKPPQPGKPKLPTTPLTITNMLSRLPFWIKSYKKATATKTTLIASIKSGSTTFPTLSLNAGTALTGTDWTPECKVYEDSTTNAELGTWTVNVTATNTTGAGMDALERLFLVVNYKLE